ncbi:hypothetical protein GGI07_004892 [Coemansia sp. Benny D115]|nr:hypothetical protein GGI07_004892 [Coemansia sp. Benny D115]
MNGFGFNTYGHLKGLVQSIAASMPKVTTLGLGDFYEMNQDIPLYNMLAAEYAERLRCISFNCPETIYSVQRFSPHLTSLRFNALSREPWVLSKIDVECLVHLDIDRLTDSFTWERFYNSPKKSTIVFSKLKSLKLNFSTHTRATEQDTGNRIMQLIEYKPITNIACPELESITFANGIYRDLWRLLSFGGNICANLKTLDVVLANSISYDYQFKLNANALEQSIESVAYELASCIPNIKDVRLSSVRTCAATSIFYNAISNGLAHQFVNYTCNTPINFIVPQFSNRLKKLSFHVSPLLQQPFPALNTDTIEHLEINNVQFPFGWEYLFSSQKDSANTVTFGMLESLRINLLSKTLQAPTSPEPVSQLGDVREKVRLYMPNLKQLEICQLQLSSASPNVEIIINRQTNVVFKGTACGLEAIKCDSDAGFKALVVDLHTSKDDEHDFYKATNRVFGVESGIGEKKLALIGDCDWLDTARIKWANLHELHVLTPTCFTLLLGIIAALPNLKQLACAKLLPENTHIKSFYNIAPLSHSILRLVIYSAESSSSQQVNNCIKYLLLATPSLRFVQCPDTSLDRQAFIRQFSLAYPHVKSAQLLRY